jgi:hypothetical protein
MTYISIAMISLDTIQISSPVTVHTKTCRGHSYEMLTCDAQMVCFDDLYSGYFRSIVCDPNTHHILSYSPVKALTADQFQAKYPDFENMFVSEVVEGTMINLFYSPEAESWEIATRGSIGGNYWFNRTQYSGEPVKQQTFRQMFMEALHCEATAEFADVPGLEYLDKMYSYSFVLQHPDNHMVYTIRSPSATLVAIYELVNVADSGEECVYQQTGTEAEYAWNAQPRVRYIGPQETELWTKVQSCLACNILRIVDGITSYAEFEKIAENLPQTAHGPKCLNVNTETIYTPMGWVLTHALTGERFAVDNPHYVRLKAIRGNNPNLQYHYLALYRINQVSEFLSWFPMYKKQFYEFYTQYHAFVTDVHNAYVSYYVLKEGKPIPKKYFVHAAKIHHNVYLPSIKSPEGKTVITHRVVREYVDSLTPSKLLYYLRYEEAE